MLKCVLFVVVVLLLAGCGKPQGVDYDKYLSKDEAGLVRYKADKMLFTGRAYALVCEECAEPLLGHWPVHFVGEYKDGVPHGEFWLPRSGRKDDFFEYRERAEQKKVIYDHGIAVHSSA